MHTHALDKDILNYLVTIVRITVKYQREWEWSERTTAALIRAIVFDNGQNSRKFQPRKRNPGRQTGPKMLPDILSTK